MATLALAAMSKTSSGGSSEAPPGVSSMLIPIVIAGLVIFSLFFLYWLLYPFILRFKIGSTQNILPESTVSNGSNGNNGSNGKNSPVTRNGSNGAAGLSSPAGASGSNGQSGGKGLPGVKGLDGEIGRPGEDGSEGIPGFSVIPVREDIYKTTLEKVYYVNGVPLIEHTTGLSSKATAMFTKEKTRISIRIENSFKTEVNKIYFKKVLRNLTESPLNGIVDPVMGDGVLGDFFINTTSNTRFGPKSGLGWPVGIPIGPLTLETIVKFNNFMDSVISTYSSARSALEITKDNELSNIHIYTQDITSKRALRTADLAAVDSLVPYLLAPLSYRAQLRIDIVASVVPAPAPTSRYGLVLTQLLDPTVSFDSQVRALTVFLTDQQRIFNLGTTTPANKTIASATITEITNEINQVKGFKAEFKADLSTTKNIILAAFKDGTDLSVTPIRGVTFSDYGPVGVDSLKASIITSNITINSAITTCQTSMDAVIDPVKALNPIV